MTTTNTAALVRQMREALIAVESPVDIGLQRRKAIAAADQWLAQQPTNQCDEARERIRAAVDAVYGARVADERREPLTRKEVTSILTDAGYGRAPAQHRADFINGLRHGERAHGIVQPAGEDKPC